MLVPMTTTKNHYVLDFASQKLIRRILRRTSQSKYDYL